MAITASMRTTAARWQTASWCATTWCTTTPAMASCGVAKPGSSATTSTDTATAIFPGSSPQAPTCWWRATTSMATTTVSFGGYGTVVRGNEIYGNSQHGVNVSKTSRAPAPCSGQPHLRQFHRHRRCRLRPYRQQRHLRQHQRRHLHRLAPPGRRHGQQQHHLPAGGGRDSHGQRANRTCAVQQHPVGGRGLWHQRQPGRRDRAAVRLQPDPSPPALRRVPACGAMCSARRWPTGRPPAARMHIRSAGTRPSWTSTAPTTCWVRHRRSREMATTTTSACARSFAGHRRRQCLPRTALRHRRA